MNASKSISLLKIIDVMIDENRQWMIETSRDEIVNDIIENNSQFRYSNRKDIYTIVNKYLNEVL